MSSDEELLKAFAGGDRQALGQLAQLYERGLLDLGMAILGSREQAEDAIQETWLRVVRYARSFDGRSAVKTWLYRIAINRCRDLLADQPEPGSPLAADPPAQVESAADAAVRKDESAKLKRAVEALPLAQREVVLLCYVQSLGHPQAAEVLDIPVGTVKSRLHSALEDLRKQLSSM